jgi:hypothetical protein
MSSPSGEKITVGTTGPGGRQSQLILSRWSGRSASRA